MAEAFSDEERSRLVGLSKLNGAHMSPQVVCDILDGYEATITADRKRIEELEIQNKELRKGAQLGPIIGLEKIMEQEKTIADQTAEIGRLRGVLEKIASWDCGCADCDGKCSACVARQVLDKKE